jgi:thiol-disulfide isomerase/thioredoxin
MRAPRGEAGPWVGTEVAVVLLVTAPGCHLCDDAKHLLTELQSDYPLKVREVELSSVEGLALSHRFSMPFPPLLLVDGVRFGHGRISRRKLVRLLDQRSGRGG